jgi:hypothetical protein
MADLLRNLPLDRVIVAEWDGVRSLFQDGWTGILGDRVVVYHRSSPTEGADAWIETETFVDGDWVDTDTLRFMLTSRGSSADQATDFRRVISVDGTAQPFDLVAVGESWAALSVHHSPVVTVLAGGVLPDRVSLETIRADQLERFERFGGPDVDSLDGA